MVIPTIMGGANNMTSVLPPTNYPMLNIFNSRDSGPITLSFYVYSYIIYYSIDIG